MTKQAADKKFNHKNQKMQEKNEANPKNSHAKTTQQKISDS